jgi:hypothetical protein
MDLESVSDEEALGGVPSRHGSLNLYTRFRSTFPVDRVSADVPATKLILDEILSAVKRAR